MMENIVIRSLNALQNPQPSPYGQRQLTPKP